MNSVRKRKEVEDGNEGEGKIREKEGKEGEGQGIEVREKDRAEELKDEESTEENLEKEKDTETSKDNDNNSTNHKKAKTEHLTTANTNNEDELEDFEVGASPFVTQTEATQQYCLPAGTLSVCQVVEERPNPRNPRWAKVKLYARSEIRQRAHKRFGGKEGLRAEREKRAQQRYEKDAMRMKDLFR
ncbi:hypothetical protein FisN_1Hh036 [Fistulifera solaris]|jgi:hypothetical protein|uniref:XPA C-terminal domain-containing protein n=1 Tax=Fistulifera solaris TaxID=1519565 RepID=A0A1Z5KRZ8_FISSO|nr:hypothetical protein FisN_1Hh036 [Fistulifera solaris]|eukprot:GAX28967.1 hypothetical protein FisN_1Hh036 [Fistulifera solaris]